METTPTPPKRRRGRPRKTAKAEEQKPEVAQSEASMKKENKAASNETAAEQTQSTPSEFPSVDERKSGLDLAAKTPVNEPMPSVSDFNPLSDAVQQREYSSPKIATGVTEDIDEPTFHQPSYQELVGEGEGEEGENPWNPIEDGNPALNDLPDKEKGAAVKTMVNAVLDLYDGAHMIAQRAVQMPEEKLVEMHRDGKINMHQRIPVGGGQDMNVLELTRTFNEQAAESLQPSEEFRKKVEPPMTRVFMKRGWGMTDEQALMLYFGQDIASKGILVYSLKSQMNQIIKLVSTEQSVASKAAERRAEQRQAAEAEEVEQEDVVNEEEEMLAGGVYDNEEALEAEDIMAPEQFVINNEENPLRDTTRHEPKSPQVKTKNVRGKKL